MEMANDVWDDLQVWNAAETPSRQVVCDRVDDMTGLAQKSLSRPSYRPGFEWSEPMNGIAKDPVAGKIPRLTGD